MLYDSKLGNDLLDMTPKAQATIKAKTDITDSIKPKNFYALKDIIQRVKR